jgi:hypothetical protein
VLDYATIARNRKEMGMNWVKGLELRREIETRSDERQSLLQNVWMISSIISSREKAPEIVLESNAGSRF